MTSSSYTEEELERYLNESGINVILKKLIAQLCVNKPAEPVKFMIEFLQNNELPAETRRKQEDHVQPMDVVPNTVEQPTATRPKQRQRRMAISSEPGANQEEITDTPIVQIPKSSETRQRLEQAVGSNILFSHLEQKERWQVFDAMREVQFDSGVTIIEQGDPNGNDMYVLDEGECDVFVASPSETKLVHHLVPGEIFGELALIYGSPRAATVKSTTNIRAWAIDRQTYRRILMENTIKKRQMYEGILNKMKILSSLKQYEKLTVADALEPISFSDGTEIVKEGDMGDSFFIIVEGEAKVCKNGTQVNVLNAGDYFGEIALLTSKPRAATVTAIGNVKCARLDRERFNRVLGPCEDLLRRNMENYQLFMQQK